MFPLRKLQINSADLQSCLQRAGTEGEGEGRGGGRERGRGGGIGGRGGRGGLP